MSYRVEVIERDGRTSMSVQTPEGLLIAPVCLSLPADDEDYRLMLDDFAGAMQAARDRREGVTVAQPTSSPATVDVWWDEKGPTARARVFREEGSPLGEALELAEVPFARLSARLQEIVRTRFVELFGKDEGA